MQYKKKNFILSCFFISGLIISPIFPAHNSMAGSRAGLPPAPPPGMRGKPINLPDVSVVGDFAPLLQIDDSDVKLDEKSLIRGVELALQGYMYPKMREDVIITFHRHGDHLGIELEEGYITILNLLNLITIKAGRSFLNFGKVNSIHFHHLPYTTRPLVINEFLGDHPARGDGASLSFLFPTPFFLQLELGAYFPPLGSHSEEGEEEEFGFKEERYLGRIWTSFSLSDEAELEIGTSALRTWGPHAHEHKDSLWVFGGDITLKYWPSAYKKLIFQTESLFLHRKIPSKTINRWGIYTFLGYWFSKYWSAGIRYDWSENPEEEIKRVHSVSACATYHFTETTYLRPMYTYNFTDNAHEFYLQMVFGIGPHAHPLK